MKTRLEKIQEILKTIKKGSFINIQYQTKPKLAKKFADIELLKRTSGCYRVGIKYANLGENKEKITGPLSYGTYFLENYIIEHKGNYYLRVYTTKNHKSKSKFFVNGVETSRKEVEETFNYKSSQPTLCFNINLDNIISIKNEVLQ